jgi:hypothetical protein
MQQAELFIGKHKEIGLSGSVADAHDHSQFETNTSQDYPRS